MTPAERNYERAGLQVRIARARLLLDLAGKVDDGAITFLLDFARDLGDECGVDCVSAFRSAQTEQLKAAQAELRRLLEREARPC